MQLYRKFSLLVLVSLLAACGGGGGGGGGTPNPAPTADAGPDQVVSPSAGVFLSGADSTDDDFITDYRWEQLSGPDVTLNQAGSETVNFTAPASAAVLEFELTVTDNEGARDTDRVTITVTQPPVADAGPDQTVRVGETVTLSGSGTDPDGTVESFSWVQSGGPVVSLNESDTATPTFTAPDLSTNEVLRFTLRVTDNDGAIAEDTVAITVIANEPPIAEAGPDQSVNEGSLVTLAGSASDSDGTVSDLQWVQTDGPAVTLSGADTATPEFTAPGVALGQTAVLTFELTATDDDGATGSDTVSVTVAGVAGINNPPTADAGADASWVGTQTVILDGSGSDPDESPSTLTFDWLQIGGPAVTLSGANQAEASFVAPDVASDTVFRFELTVTDSDGASASDTVDITVTPAPATVTISGKVEFEFVPRGDFGSGLNFDLTYALPIRGATVQAVDNADATVLASAVSGETGDYELVVPSNTDVFIRVRAELKRTGSPAWDVEVRDNTSETGLPLDQRPLYALDGAVGSSSVVDSTRDLLAETGWTGSGYTEPRAAAPFSILDVIYRAMQLVTSVDPDAQFAPLDAFWSVDNTPTSGDIDLGEIGTSFYRGSIDSLFLLGDANADTEEFDTHVIAHEWGHYFEDVLSRADSPGGRHSLDNRLDARLAFGEGWGNAVAGMIMDDPVYFDTFPSGSFSFSVDTESTFAEGWYNETSTQSILWDLFDSSNDGAESADSIALGFGPLYDVLVGPQRVTPAFTTIFSFIDALKDDRPGDTAAIEALVTDQSIDPIGDIWGDGEATNNPGATDLLPVHAELQLGAPVQDLCVTTQFDPNEDGNKLGIFRYLRFTAATSGNYRISVTTTNPPSADTGEPEQYSDPDFFVFRSGAFIEVGGTGTKNAESLDLLDLPVGIYVIELFEAGFPNVYGFGSDSAEFDQTTMCFDVSLTQF